MVSLREQFFSGMGMGINPHTCILENTQYQITNVKTVKILEVIDGKSEINSEPYEAPSGPSYFSGGEPGAQGYWQESKTVSAKLLVEVTTHDGQPVEINESNIRAFHDTLNPKVTDDISEEMIPAIQNSPEYSQIFNGFDTSISKWDTQIAGGNRVVVLLVIECVNDTPPDSYDGPDN